MRNIKGLTGLRFVAAFYVFIFHIDMARRTPLTYLPWRIETIVQQGYLGVTLFFVLSGFVLTYTNLKDFGAMEFKSLRFLGQFMYKRFARVYPAFLAGLILCIPISLYFDKLPGIKIIVLCATLLQTYFNGIAMKWYNYSAWSIGNEFFFYLLFPFVLPVLLLIRKKAWLIVLVGIIALLGTYISSVQTGLLSVRFPFPFPYAWAYWFPPIRFQEFLAGMAAGLLMFRFNWQVPAWVGILLVGLSAVYLSYAAPLLPGNLIHNWLIVPTCVVLLAVLSQPKQSPAFKWLESAPMQYLGQVSYCFYIVQIPLLITLDNLIKAGTIKHSNLWVGPVLFVLNLVGSILMHELVEKKAHHYLMAIFKKRSVAEASKDAEAVLMKK